VTLSLSFTEVSGKGLEHIKHLAQLRALYLFNAKVTESGVSDLAKSLPKCRIVWKGGIIEPKEK
jgi:hypothetical protein